MTIKVVYIEASPL